MELKVPKRERGGSGKLAATVLVASLAIAAANASAANKKPACPKPVKNSPAATYARDIGCELAGLWQHNHHTVKKQPDPNYPGGIEILTSAQVGGTWRRAIAYMLESALGQPEPQTTYEVDSEVGVCKDHSNCGNIHNWWWQETIVYLRGSTWQAIKYTGHPGHSNPRLKTADSIAKVQNWAAASDTIVRSVTTSAHTELPKTIQHQNRVG